MTGHVPVPCWRPMTQQWRLELSTARARQRRQPLRVRGTPDGEAPSVRACKCPRAAQSCRRNPDLLTWVANLYLTTMHERVQARHDVNSISVITLRLGLP